MNRLAKWALSGAMLSGMLIFGGAAPSQSVKLLQPDGSVFRKNVKVSKTEQFLLVQSDGIPDHTTGDFPNRFNPNTILKQNYNFKIPLQPKIAEKVTKLPMGPIGVAINGVPFYNPYNAEGQDASKNEVFDDCCGHPDPAGRYHYHIYPKCIHTSFSDPAGQHSPLIGYAFDGIAIYGPNGTGGKPPTDVDECNGHSDDVLGYHYHVTNKFPYIIGGYRGVVDSSSFDRPPNGGGQRRGGRGGQQGPGSGSADGGQSDGGPPNGGPPNGGPPNGGPPNGGPPNGGPPGMGPGNGPPPGGPGGPPPGGRGGRGGRRPPPPPPPDGDGD